MVTTLKPEWIKSEGYSIGYYPYVPQIPYEIVLRKYGVSTVIKL